MSTYKRRRNLIICIVLAVLLIIMFFASMNAGYTSMGLKNIIKILMGAGSKKDNIVILDFRLPRICIAMLAGAGFSLAGCVLQAITKNPLADTGLLGINAGAGLMVISYITFSGTLSFFSLLALPVFSLIGGGLTGIAIYLLAAEKGRGVQPVALVLTGVAVQAGINSLMTLIVLKLDETQHQFLAKWQAGSIWNSTWNSVITLVPWIAVGFIFLIFKAKTLDILSIGDEVATGLGVRTAKEKRQILFMAIALAAASVSISGSISFVGLIAPHLTRKLVGMKHIVLLPACALVGALLVLTADTVGRVVIEPSELPTGIVVSILGAPYFLFLLIRYRKGSR
jgi:iron complex transport system permease protein